MNYFISDTHFGGETILTRENRPFISEVFDGDFLKFREFAIGTGFREVYEELYLIMRSKQFYLNHYPFKHKDGCINLFGHTHKVTGLRKPFGLNVSCDLNHFFLFSEDEIFRLLRMKKDFWEQDFEVLCR